MGVKRKFAREARGAFAPFLILEAFRREAPRIGITQAEYSWILEDNLPMRHILESFGAKIYKTYRIYGKALSGAAAPAASETDPGLTL
jgi:hypothetical protein